MQVTILIPTYNYAHYILDAIRSIEAQSYPLNLIELVVIDDGSTDDTKQVIENYKSDLRIRYYYQENKGKALATQLGVEKSNGEVVFNLDADDYFYPEKLASVIAIYSKYPEVVSVGHPADIIYTDTLLKEKETIPEEILNKEINGISQLEYFLDKRNLFGGGSTFSARTKALRHSPVSNGVDMYIDEYLIFATYAQGNIFLLNSHLSVWRVHGRNYSVDLDITTYKVKLDRLLNSSKAMLFFVEDHIVLSNRIKELYRLKHLDRYYTSLEASDQKGIKDILKLTKSIISGKYYFKDLRNYRLFNRLIPTFLVKRLKQILNKKNLI